MVKPARNDGQDDVVFVSDAFMVALNELKVAVADWLCDCFREDADAEIRGQKRDEYIIYITRAEGSAAPGGSQADAVTKRLSEWFTRAA